MINTNEDAKREAEELFNEIRSYERTIELVYNKYFTTK